MQSKNDPFATNFIYPGKQWGEAVARYEKNGTVTSVFTSDGDAVFAQNGQKLNEWNATQKKEDVRFSQSFDLKDSSLLWNLSLTNETGSAIRIEDLAIPFFYNNAETEEPSQIFEQRVMEHKFISGNNSYLFWMRPSGVGPYLLMTPQQGTSLEYFKTAPFKDEDGTSQVFIHSAYTGAHQKGTWRQPLTSLLLAAHQTKTYGFTFRWARDYNEIRRILAEEGLIDVHVAPGMTVPVDLEVRIALHTKQPLKNLQAEFPKESSIRFAGKKGSDTYLYQVHFTRLGENKITIRYAKNNTAYLEFFATEPLETLYKKRASFIANHQQHRDSTKWYNGLFSVYDMKDSMLRGPDNDDGFNKSRLTYLLTCDDPALCKAPFVAAKNVFYPAQDEIDAVEYYLKHYVWGGLQRTDKESNPYGVYGTPNWLVGRDSAKRAANLNDENRNKMHIWRSYDYPHIIMLYYHMYQIASLYPGMTHYLDAKEYLIRAKETAKAYFTYPYQILPWYETYKWGCYNELLIPDLIEVLKQKGYGKDADWLTKEWEKKVKYFIYDDKYPFRSEYAVDATAYESTEAFARYALEHPMQPDSLLWYDKNLKKWYSHPNITDSAARRFMNAQMQANIASRGWLEPSYYDLGSDYRGGNGHYLLSYMAQMGGWGVLDYGLNYAEHPTDYIRLGYASYLSSFALMNTGTSQSHYGFWYGGKENDGASGWAFEPQQNAVSWIGKPQGRGPWYYDGEIDLGYGGATRCAATVVVNDSLFGWMAYGGSLEKRNDVVEVVPKDGLRRKLYYRADGKKIDVELDRDGFAKDKMVAINTKTFDMRLLIENRTQNSHSTTLQLKGLKGIYEVWIRGQRVLTVQLNDGINKIEVPVSGSDENMLVEMKRL